jgi:hypothetical protein
LIVKTYFFRNESLKHRVYWLNDQYKHEKLKCDELILADGQISSAFLYTYLLNHLNSTNMRPVGLTATQSEYKVFQTKQEAYLSGNKNCLNKMRTNFIYHVHNINGKSYAICQLFNQIRPCEVYEWIEEFYSRVEFKHCSIFCNQNSTQYFDNKSSDQQHFPCVKFLSNDEKLNVLNETRLAEPNFVSNLPAACNFIFDY